MPTARPLIVTQQLGPIRKLLLACRTAAVVATGFAIASVERVDLNRD
jgi:hypothetical protein